MSQSIFPGPIAPENNPPIHPDYYQPRRFEISGITLNKTTTVTTSEEHDYVVGQVVRLLIPTFYGSYQLNERQGMVISIPAVDQVEIDINSSQGVNAFIASPTYGPTPPQIVAIGDYNSGAINTGRSNNTISIAGSFINISPG